MPKLNYTKAHISAYNCKTVHMYAWLLAFMYKCTYINKCLHLCTNNNHQYNTATLLHFSFFTLILRRRNAFPANSPHPPTRKSKLLAALCRATNRRPLCIHWLRRATGCAAQDQKRNTTTTTTTNGCMCVFV